MRGKNILIIVFAVISLLLLWLFIDEREKAKKKDKILEKLREDNIELRNGYLTLLERYLKDTKKAEPSVINELISLKSDVDNLDTEIHVELNSVIKRVTDGEGTKAVKDLAKIVENILKEKIIDKEDFKRKPMLHNLLEYARDKNIICNRLFVNGIKLKELRNKESHELNPSVSSLEIGMSIYSGIEIIYAVK